MTFCLLRDDRDKSTNVFSATVATLSALTSLLSSHFLRHWNKKENQRNSGIHFSLSLARRAARFSGLEYCMAFALRQRGVYRSFFIRITNPAETQIKNNCTHVSVAFAACWNCVWSFVKLISNVPHKTNCTEVWTTRPSSHELRVGIPDEKPIDRSHIDTLNDQANTGNRLLSRNPVTFLESFFIQMSSSYSD